MVKLRQWGEQHRWVTRLMAMAMAMMLCFGVAPKDSPVSPPQAEAQAMPGVDVLAGMLGGRGGVKDIVCKGGGNLVDCINDLAGSGAKSAANLEKIFGCLSKGVGSGGEGGEDDKSVAECIDKALNEEEEEDEEEVIDNFSMQAMSAAMATFYDSSLGQQLMEKKDDEGDSESEGEDADPAEILKKQEPKGWDAMKPWVSTAANGGSVVGFAHHAPRGKHKGNLFSTENYNEMIYDYEVLKTIGGTGGSGGSIEGVINSVLGGSSGTSSGPYDYALYGATLRDTGLDSTMSHEATDVTQRKLMGSVMLVSFLGAGLIDGVFNMVLGLLQTLNPFTLMKPAIAENTDPGFTAGFNSDMADSSEWGGLAKFFGQLYNGALTVGWAVTIPLAIGLFILGALMFRRFEKGRKLKHIVAMIALPVVILPLAGVTYTAGLDSMKEWSTSSSTANSSKIVASTYVDFEAWAENNRLGLPGHTDAIGGLRWDLEDGHASEKSQANARYLALAVNAAANPAFKGFEYDQDTLAGLGGRRYNDWVMEDAYTAKNGGTGIGGFTPSDTNATGEGGKNNFAATVNLINRFITSEQVSASGAGSAARASLVQWVGEDPARAGKAVSWVKTYTDPDALSEITQKELQESPNPLVFVQQGSGLQTQRQGNELSFTNKGAGFGEGAVCLPGDIFAGQGTGFSPKMSDKPSLSTCNMSSLAFYNYLNSSFGPTSVSVYSADSTSGWSRNLHASVNAVGAGAMAYVYWFSSVTLLLSFLIIGIGYAMSMLFNALKKSVQLIGAVPFAAIGFVAGIAKVIVYTIAMFIEIIGTLFMYRVMQELLMAIPTLLESPLTGALSSQDAKDGVLLGMGAMGAIFADHPLVMSVIITVVSTLGIVIFTIMAMKLRGSFISAVDEALTRVVNRFLDTDVGSGRGGAGGGSGLRQGLATGAGMMATSHMLRAGSGAAAGDGGDVDGGDAGDGGVGSNGPDGSGGDGLEYKNASSSAAGDGDYDGYLANAALWGGAGAGAATALADDPDAAMMGEAYGVNDDGVLVDSSGNPIENAAGGAMTLDDSASINSEGQLLDSEGNVAYGAHGEPLTTADVAGINELGYFTDADGNTLLDHNGEPIAADMSTRQGMTDGSGQGQFDTATMSDAALAEQVEAHGLSDEPSGMDTVPAGAAGVAGGAMAAELASSTDGGGEMVDGTAEVSAGGDGAQFAQASYDGAGTMDGVGAVEGEAGDTSGVKALGDMSASHAATGEAMATGGTLAAGSAMAGDSGEMTGVEAPASYDVDGSVADNAQGVYNNISSGLQEAGQQLSAAGEHSGIGETIRNAGVMGAAGVAAAGAMAAHNSGGNVVAGALHNMEHAGASMGQQGNPQIQNVSQHSGTPASNMDDRRGMTAMGTAGLGMAAAAPGVANRSMTQAANSQPVTPQQTGSNNDNAALKYMGASMAGQMVSRAVAGNQKRDGMADGVFRGSMSSADGRGQGQDPEKNPRQRSGGGMMTSMANTAMRAGMYGSHAGAAVAPGTTGMAGAAGMAGMAGRPGRMPKQGRNMEQTSLARGLRDKRRDGRNQRDEEFAFGSRRGRRGDQPRSGMDASLRPEGSQAQRRNIGGAEGPQSQNRGLDNSSGVADV